MPSSSVPSPTAASPAPERLHALDAVRGLALLLGIVLHATISFIPTPTRFWIIQDNQSSLTMAFLFFAIHVFRMTTFFLIAGFFAHMSFHRRGTTGFIRDRLQRIALPFLVGWPILFSVMGLVVYWASGFPNGGPIPGASRWPPVLPRFPLTHLWFLYVLLELYVAALLLRAGIAWIDLDGRRRAGADRLIAAIMRSRLAPAMLALPIGISMCLDPTWVGWMGIRTPDQSLLINSQALIGFGSAFGFGWLLHRQIDLLKILEARWLSNLLVAVFLIAASFVLTILLYAPAGAVPFNAKTIRLASAIVYAPAIWTATFACIGLALRFLSGFSPALRYLADASYWLYLIHMPIIMALQVAVSQLSWPWSLKFIAILAIALPPMLISYQLIVRYTFIGTILNGRRQRRAQPLAVAAGPAAT